MLSALKDDVSNRGNTTLEVIKILLSGTCNVSEGFYAWGNIIKNQHH